MCVVSDIMETILMFSKKRIIIVKYILQTALCENIEQLFLNALTVPSKLKKIFFY